MQENFPLSGMHFGKELGLDQQPDRCNQISCLVLLGEDTVILDNYIITKPHGVQQLF